MWKLKAVGSAVVLLGALCGCGGPTENEPAEPTCGGDPVGSWEASGASVPPRPVTSVDACWNLQLSRGADGSLAASTRHKTPSTRDGVARFNADGTFAMGITARGDVVMTYGASCLNAVSPQPSCDELAPPLALSGAGEGTVRGVACVAAGGGGCDCTFAVAEVAGYTGTWLASGTQLSLAPVFGPMNQPAVVGSYCAKDGTLQLSSDFDERFYGVSRLLFVVQATTP